MNSWVECDKSVTCQAKKKKHYKNDKTTIEFRSHLVSLKMTGLTKQVKASEEIK